MKISIFPTALLAIYTFAAQAQPVMRDGVLVDAAGRTVYIFDRDTPGKSNCTGGCLTAWPAFVAKDGAAHAGDFTLIDSNGAKQWAVKGKPLYYFVGDTKPGDRNGEGSGGVWHTVGGAAKASATSGTY